MTSPSVASACFRKSSLLFWLLAFCAACGGGSGSPPTSAVPDALPTPGQPAISAVSSANVTSGSATITWITSENADSQIEFGPTSAYGSRSSLDGALVTSHSEVLSGLAGSTTYHFRVKSRDAAGNLTASGDFVLSTSPIAAAQLAGYPASDGTIYWLGDFETGDLSQFVGSQEENGVVPTVVSAGTNPGGQGSYSGQFQIFASTPTSGTLSRSEATTSQAQTGGYPGQTWYYTWQMYFPSATVSWSNQWNNLAQWIDTLYQCSPPISVGVSVPLETGSTRYLSIYNQALDNANGCAPLTQWQQWTIEVPKLDHWYTMTMLIKFSSDPTVGYAQAWLDGREVLPLTHMRTVDNGGNYFELHNYQGSPNRASTIYFDAARRHQCYLLAACVVNP